MAEKDLELNPEDEDPSSSGKKGIIIYALIGLLAVGAGIGGTLFFVSSGGETSDGEVAAEPVKKKAKYYPIKPPFVLNFRDGKGRQRFLQIGVSIMSREPDAIDALRAHAPLIRNNLILLFSAQEFTELQKPEGKDKLAEQTLLELQAFLQEEIESPGIEKVLFTDFVMQ
ncbi:MAG: flagellar basal body-associated FliL family protein [Gammaproteobacteria bacterium]|nr:flagellar basal body-associated FliL family protein [Gammaproteobacteria bacterium]